MNNLKMFCISLNPEHFEVIKNLSYIPVGLGDAEFSNNWITDKLENGIHLKNPYYGEYTFHYVLWKNYYLDESKWIGFCQYRKFWSLVNVNTKNLSLENFNSILLKTIPEKFDDYEVILGEDMYVNQFRFSKFLKRNLKKMILNPSLLINQRKRNLKFHFDMWHGEGNIDKAIQLLDVTEKNDFKNFLDNNVSFNPHNMFICKSKEILFNYYNSIFPWLERCEKIFGFKNLKGYGLQRIYGFLAERYLSYWFKKYTKYTVLPIIFKDISDFNYKDL